MQSSPVASKWMSYSINGYIMDDLKSRTGIFRQPRGTEWFFPVLDLAYEQLRLSLTTWYESNCSKHSSLKVEWAEIHWEMALRSPILWLCRCGSAPTERTAPFLLGNTRMSQGIAAETVSTGSVTLQTDRHSNKPQHSVLFAVSFLIKHTLCKYVCISLKMEINLWNTWRLFIFQYTLASRRQKVGNGKGVWEIGRRVKFVAVIQRDGQERTSQSYCKWCNSITVMLLTFQGYLRLFSHKFPLCDYYRKHCHNKRIFLAQFNAGQEIWLYTHRRMKFTG